MSRRSLPLWIGLFVTLMLIAFRPWGGTPHGETIDTKPAAPASQIDTRTERTEPSANARAPARVNKKRSVDAQERDRYRDAILQGLATRAAETQPAQAQTARRSPERDDAQTARPGLTDRSDGKLTSLMADFNDDVMPLADECYEQALERDPTVAGGLDLQFQIIGDQDVGGLVESMEFQESSQIRDPEMIQCIQETLLSTIFPAPHDSGSTAIQLSLRFSPDDAR